MSIFGYIWRSSIRVPSVMILWSSSRFVDKLSTRQEVSLHEDCWLRPEQMRTTDCDQNIWGQLSKAEADEDNWLWLEQRGLLTAAGGKPAAWVRGEYSSTWQQLLVQLTGQSNRKECNHLGPVNQRHCNASGTALPTAGCAATIHIRVGWYWN
jgi:hypothetical protein